MKDSFVIKDSVIKTADAEDCKAFLRYLLKQGYGEYDSGCEKYVDTDPDWLYVVISCNGRGLNTRLTTQRIARDFNLHGLIIFPSVRHFLTSNRNVSITGEPMAHHFI